MPHAIRIHRTGGPEVLQWDEISVGDPGPGEIRVRQTAVGLNYIDTYHRTGLYKLALPASSRRSARASRASAQATVSPTAPVSAPMPRRG